MSNSRLVSFNFTGTQAVRVLVVHGNPWFVASDVCTALGLTNSRVALGALDQDEKDVSSTYTPGGKQKVAIISEAGMYTLVLRCRDAIKPGTTAYRFRKWVTSEVLPSIRKTGGYQAQEAPSEQEELELAEPEPAPVPAVVRRPIIKVKRRFEIQPHDQLEMLAEQSRDGKLAGAAVAYVMENGEVGYALIGLMSGDLGMTARVLDRLVNKVDSLCRRS